jgi:hypothetical protein
VRECADGGGDCTRHRRITTECKHRCNGRELTKGELTSVRACESGHLD